jgi:hypothetical protein
MIQTIKKMILSSTVLALLFAPALVSVGSVSATSHEGGLFNCEGKTIGECAKTGAESTDPDQTVADPETTVSDLVEDVINIFSIVVGIIAVIMIIIGGLKYITSGGDTGNVTGAKNTILYAVVGLIVVVLAQIVVRFVLARTVPPAA